MIQGTFNPTEISQALERIQSMGCQLRAEEDKVIVQPCKALTQPEREEIKNLCQRYKPGLLALLQGQRVNDFAESLEKGSNSIHNDFLDEVYRRAFYNFDWCKRSKSGPTVAQKAGSDVVIYTTSDRVYRADEKRRERFYNDIALEYISNNRKNTPGWIEKDLGIDYLVYAFIPVKQAYLFPWQQLKMVWEKNKANWLRLAKEKGGGFYIVSSPNPTYYTLSCAVPTALLISEVKGAMFFQL